MLGFQPVNNNPDSKLAHQKENGLVPIWATSFEMLENADTDPNIIADLLATGCDPSKEYVLHIVDRGEDLKGFGENTFVPTWENLQAPANDYLGKKHKSDTIKNVLNSEYQAKYAEHMEAYRDSGLGEFDKTDQESFGSALDANSEKSFSARHALRTEFGANSEFTGNGMTQCRLSGNKVGVVETLTLENDPPPISKMKNLRTIKLQPIERV